MAAFVNNKLARKMQQCLFSLEEEFMSARKKIGILGGTFDPIHIAHLILAENAYEQFDLETILIMPTYVPPHKLNKEVTSAQHRTKMVQLAIEDNKHFKLSTIELERGGLTYTSDTLSELTANNPENEYYFIIGADSLSQIEEWYKPQIIMQNAVLLVAVREHMEIETIEEMINELKEKYQAKIYLLRTSNMDISSSMLRKKVAAGENIKYYVPKDVEKYIYQNHLYRE